MVLRGSFEVDVIKTKNSKRPVPRVMRSGDSVCHFVELAGSGEAARLSM
jgi:hypothetical protein